MEKKKESWADFFSYVVYDIFFTSFFIYGVSFFLESFYKGIVVNYVNLKTVLIVCIVSGILSVLHPPQKMAKSAGFWNAIFVCIFSVAAAVYTYQMYPEAWRWRMVFSVSVGVALLSVLIILSRAAPESTEPSK